MSSNLVKNIFTTLSRDEEKRIIDSNAVVRRRLEMLEAELGLPQAEGFVSGIPAAEIVDVPEDTQGNIIKAQDEAREILESARADADAMIAQAQEDAERIREQARADAEAEKAQVLGDARQQGFNEGLVKAQAHEGAMEQEYLEKTRSLEEAYEKQLDTLEPRFVDAITGIYEHIFQVELSSYREILIYLISTVLHKLDGSRSFMIHVSREDYAYVSMQKKQMLAGAVSGNCEVDVVEDLTLGKNDCMIETEGGIFDCGLGTQLSELRRRLHLLAWSQDRDIS